MGNINNIQKDSPKQKGRTNIALEGGTMNGAASIKQAKHMEPGKWKVKFQILDSIGRESSQMIRVG